MPLLERLDISPEIELDDDEEPEDMSCMDSDDLASICRGCPALQWLDVARAVQPGADLSVLAQLPASCTSLRVGGAAFTDAAPSVLAQLTNLEYLCWRHSAGFIDAGLEQLTALDLGRLYVYNSGLSDAINPREPGTLDIQCQDRVEVSPGQLGVSCFTSLDAHFAPHMSGLPLFGAHHVPRTARRQGAPNACLLTACTLHLGGMVCKSGPTVVLGACALIIRRTCHSETVVYLSAASSRAHITHWFFCYCRELAVDSCAV
jgi:hypothetical protein